METKQTFSKNKKFSFYAFLALVPIAVTVLLYMIYAAYKTADFYQYIKTNQRGWIGNVHVADAELGYRSVPNSEGAHVFPVGPNIPMRYDGDGFRAPMQVDPYSHARPLILILGCSYTYGDAIYAKDAYPYLVGLWLNGTSKNSGVCGYGLSQMLLLARELIPIHKPDYLLVQYSEWLLDRAQNPFAESYFGKLPTPFFYEKDQSFALYPPVFLTKIMELPVDRYRNTPNSWIDALSFFWNVRLPLSVHDDFHMLKYIAYKNIGIIPNPTSSRDELIKYVYKEINNEAEKYGAKTVIVVLGLDETPVEVNEQLFPSNALLVNAHDELLQHLPNISDESYMKMYAHWRGSPPKVVDFHPNELAHRRLARAIVSAITQSEMEAPN